VETRVSYTYPSGGGKYRLGTEGSPEDRLYGLGRH